jgi:SAM-dependent methyltransferase
MNPSRFHLERFVQRAAGSVRKGGLILDVGAGDAPYRPLFRHACYETADFCQVDKPYSVPTHVCDITSIPVEDGRYDLVLMTQVLEHLPDPLKALREINRITRPGGRLWLSCPFYYPEHEQPFDYYRYTQFGLRHLVSQAGFIVEELEWLEGYSAAVSHQLDMARRELPGSPRAFGGGLTGAATSLLVGASRPWLRLLAYSLARADTRAMWTSSGMCKNYAVVAEKRDNTSSDA